MSFSVLLHRRQIERQRPIESPARDIAPDDCLSNILHFSILILHFAFSQLRFWQAGPATAGRCAGRKRLKKLKCKMQNAK
jgi:hypothetical protein